MYKNGGTCKCTPFCIYMHVQKIVMKKSHLIILLVTFCFFVTVAFKKTIHTSEVYRSTYDEKINHFKKAQTDLIDLIKDNAFDSPETIAKIKEEIDLVRLEMKGVDFWLRYLEPLSYKKINGPLPVEWETEVFEKFEKPYKREGAGLTLATLYLEESDVKKDSLLRLVQLSLKASEVYTADSIVDDLNTYHHFFFCNRLFLLNLASIYTTGFECPDTARVIPELRSMLSDVQTIYTALNRTFPETSLSDSYMKLYAEAIVFVKQQPQEYTLFDHYTFLKKFTNPLFFYNQKMIVQYKANSKSLVDYSLSKNSTSIFSKNLYHGQNTKGVFIRVKDKDALALLDKVGKLLFYDPILSANNKRSCVSCHKPTQFFTDTSRVTSLQLNQKDILNRNTPSLVNSEYNHLLMLDGKHISLQSQGKAVMTDPLEMGSQEKEVLRKILSCKEYKEAFEKLLIHTPQEKEITFDHIVSAITFYYTKFSLFNAPFDESMNTEKNIDDRVKKGFNVFMSKAQCATCHFVPQFNGVKPPFVNSEFEVLGVPKDLQFSALSEDKGRYEINAAKETLHAFRTGSLRNIEHTKPYMHNGVFASLNEVIDFYDAGGGSGRGIDVDNQTLSSDSLHLSVEEKENVLLFMKSLNENIAFEFPPSVLPLSKVKQLNTRKVGGEY